MVHERGRQGIEEVHVVDNQDDRAPAGAVCEVASDDREQIDLFDGNEIVRQESGERAKGQRARRHGGCDELHVMIGK